MSKNQNGSNWNRDAIFELIFKEYQSCKREKVTLACNLSETDIQKKDLSIHEAGITAFFKSLLARVKQMIQSSTENAKSHLEEEQTAKELQQNDVAINAIREQKRGDTSDLRKLIITYDWSHYPIKVVLEIVIFGAEIFINAISFTAIGGNILSALPGSILFSVALSLIAYYLPRWIKKKELKKDRIRAIVLTILGMVFIFACVAILRGIIVFGDGSLNSLNSQSVLLSSIFFAALNLFIFIGAASLSYFGLPSKEERLIKKEYDRLTKRIAQTEKQINSMLSVNALLSARLASQKQQRIIAEGEELHIEDYINSLCEETIAAFYAEFDVKKKKNNL